MRSIVITWSDCSVLCKSKWQDRPDATVIRRSCASRLGFVLVLCKTRMLVLCKTKMAGSAEWSGSAGLAPGGAMAPRTRAEKRTDGKGSRHSRIAGTSATRRLRRELFQSLQRPRRDELGPPHGAIRVIR